MEEEKFSILNENELEVKGTITRPKKTGRFALLVLAPDLLENTDTAAVKELSRLALEKGLAVCRFDFTNGTGKSGGRIENITISQRARDLGIVIQYCKRRAYINESKVLIAGLGFGAMAALVLEGFHALAKAMVLVNTPSQVDDTAWTSFVERDMVRVKLKRYFHITQDGQEIRINYTFFEDGYRLDMFRCARNLRTPTLYLAGSQNEIIKPYHSERLFERTNGKKEMEVVPIGHNLDRKQLALVFERALTFFKKQKAL